MPSRTNRGPSFYPIARRNGKRNGKTSSPSTRKATSSAGMVTRKIKGGLLVNIGVNVFLPASQVDIRRPPDIADYIGKTIECKILKIDEARHNIVVSRRKLIEDNRTTMKQKLLAEIQPGQIRKGTVKNIAEFGAFVDLGGIDGLLHITDMSWGRVNNPHEVVQIDQELEVYIITVDKDKEKIALGLKQKSPSPWEEVEKKYPDQQPAHGRSRQRHELRGLRQAGAGHRGAGAHQRNELDQAHQSPRASWSRLATRSKCRSSTSTRTSRRFRSASSRCSPIRGTRWPNGIRPDTQIEGVVRNLTNYGAFIEIEEGIDGLLARQRHELGPQGGPSVRRAEQGGEGQVRHPERRSGTQTCRPGPQADLQ